MKRILSVVFVAANMITAGCGQLPPRLISEIGEKVADAVEKEQDVDSAAADDSDSASRQSQTSQSGRQNSQPPAAGDSSHRNAGLPSSNSTLNNAAKTSPDAIFCPPASWYSPAEKMCVTETQAVGPFTGEMIALCKQFGGGNDACEGVRWERKFAARLRLGERCPRGAVFDAARDACAEGENVFGPFRLRDVEECKRRGGGPPCESMRWNAAFMPLRIRGGSANRKLYDFYSDRNNYDKVFEKVLNFYPAGRRNGCVAFMSTALRMSGTAVPQSEYIDGESVSLVTKPFAQYMIQRLNWTKVTSANNLQPGDVVLTEDDARYPSYPAHTYMFYGWSNQKAGIGWVIDNQDFIHERNIFGYGTYNFTPFAYALRSPE